jgi:formyltetrahydrofolate synthetase
LLILSKDQKARALLKAKREKKELEVQQRNILDYHNAFKSITQLKKYNIDEFIDSNSYFSKSVEEIKMLFKAFQEPDVYKDILRSFNLTEERYTEPESASVKVLK